MIPEMIPASRCKHIGCLIAFSVLIGFAGCGLEGDLGYPFNREYSYSYSAVDSTGFEVVAGSVKFKIEATRWGCTTEKCADIEGTWDFVSRVIPPIAPHPVGTGRVTGIVTDDFETRMTAGPDSRDNQVVLRFPTPPRPEMTGTWTSPSGEGGPAVFREK